jgi:hypothetical protein
MPTNGKTIILDAVALCTQLTNAFVDTAGDIASTHSVIYDEVLPYNVINEICKKATTVGGVIGFDAYVDAAGNLHVFATGKYTSSVSPSMIKYDRPINAHRIRNKQTVYGAKGFYPSTGDDWTESITGWTTVAGTMVADSTNAKVGTYDLQIHSGATPGTLDAYYMFNQMFAGDEFNKSFNKFSIWVGWNVAGEFGNIEIRLLGPDRTNYFSFTIDGSKLSFPNTKWAQVTQDIGRKNDTLWTKTGSPSWDNIQGIEIITTDTIAYGSFWFDGLHFEGGNISGVASDSVSIAKYGVRWSNTQTDDTLKTSAECQLKAQSLVNFLKGVIDSFTITVDGDNGYTPGDKVHVIIPNDSVDAYYRIMQVRHIIDGVTWDTELTLSNEPKLMDYIFASANAPKYAGATIVVPRDFTTIQQGVNALVIT